MKAVSSFGALVALVSVVSLVGCPGTKSNEDAGGEDSGTPVTDGGPSISTNPSDGGALPQQNAVCDAAAQTGCSGVTPRCGLVAPGGFACVAPGTVQEYGTCTPAGPTGDNCASGLFCFRGECRKFCDQTNACGASGSCSLRVTWNNGPPNGAVFDSCVKPGFTCDPFSQNCSDATEGCYVTDTGTQCLMPGTKTEGQECGYSNECAKGGTCISASNVLDGGFFCRTACFTPPADGGFDAGTDGGVFPDAGCTAGTCLPVTGAPPGFGFCG